MSLRIIAVAAVALFTVACAGTASQTASSAAYPGAGAPFSPPPAAAAAELAPSGQSSVTVGGGSLPIDDIESGCPVVDGPMLGGAY